MLDAAVSGDAYDTDTMMAVLRPMTRLSEITDTKTGKGTGKFEVKVDFPDTDPNTGEPIAALHTPQTAVKRMKELPQVRQPLQVRRRQRRRGECGNRRPYAGQQRQG